MELLSSDSLERDRKQKFEEIFQKEIYPRFFSNLKKPAYTQPRIAFIGGQPGSGKSVRERYIVSVLNDEEPNTAIEINGDDFRAFHPDYYSFLVEDDATAASKIDHDNKFFIERSIEASIKTGAHVVLEGTFRQADVVKSTAERFNDSGYASEAILLVVHPILSRVGIMRRYFEQKALSPFARYTELTAHNAALNGIEATVKGLIENGDIDAIHLITRSGELLLNSNLSGLSKQELHLISDGVTEVLNNSWHNLSKQDKEFAIQEVNLVTEIARGLTIPSKIISDLNELKLLIESSPTSA